MAIFQELNETIEGEKVSGNTRKWLAKGLKKHPVTRQNMFLYVTDRNSSAEVREEGKIPEDEKMKDLTAHFHRKVGDRLEADSLSLYVNQRTPLRPQVKEGVSARHGATVFNTSKQTIATIRTPLANILTRLGYTFKEIEK